MKKLHRKSAVHPSPSAVYDHLLPFLPAAMFALAAALSPADREVLAYLVSCSSASFSASRQKTTAGGDHTPSFNCSCFRCYMSYWVKWDSSPDRLLIHEIIDAFEENLTKERKMEKGRKEKRQRSKNAQCVVAAVDAEESANSGVDLKEESFSFREENAVAKAADDASNCGGEEEEEESSASGEEDSDKGSVRRFVSFLGARIWGVWS